jgi:hypothetical protein
MSTGMDCHFREKKDGWYYDIQVNYDPEEDYDKHGPFKTFRAAQRHLDRHHGNPGGYSIEALPGCKHDLARPMSHPYSGYTHDCDRCGSAVTVVA